MHCGQLHASIMPPKKKFVLSVLDKMRNFVSERYSDSDTSGSEDVLSQSVLEAEMSLCGDNTKVGEQCHGFPNWHSNFDISLRVCHSILV